MALAFFSLLVTPVVAHAQGTGKQNYLPGNAPNGVMRLTLDQAVSLALKQNPTAQIAVLTAGESVQDKNVARAALLDQRDPLVGNIVIGLGIRSDQPFSSEAAHR